MGCGSPARFAKFVRRGGRGNSGKLNKGNIAAEPSGRAFLTASLMTNKPIISARLGCARRLGSFVTNFTDLEAGRRAPHEFITNLISPASSRQQQLYKARVAAATQDEGDPANREQQLCGCISKHPPGPRNKEGDSGLSPGYRPPRLVPNRVFSPWFWHSLFPNFVVEGITGGRQMGGAAYGGARPF